MKIGLLTVHCSTNPGASLQAYALSEKLKQLGMDVSLIDYRPFYFTSDVDPVNKKKVKKGIKSQIGMLLMGGKLRKEYKGYLEFEDQFLPNKTKRYNSLEELEADTPKCDAFICGSDQIWNPQHTRYDSVMELSFAKKAGIPSYSYAASIGQDVLTDKDLSFLQDNIRGFHGISVREESAKDILESKLGFENVLRHIDPTLLLDKGEWREIESNKHEDIKGKYIVFYPLADNPIVPSLLEKIKQKYKLPIVAMSRRLKKNKNVDIQLRMFTPNDFVDLIDHAEYVVTNSFHGCVFSLLFGKKLISYKNQARNTRMECLFDMFGVKKPQIEDISELDQTEFEKRMQQIKIDTEILKNERATAHVYLEGIKTNGR